MKATEVISKLQQLVAEHGDLNCEYPYEVESTKEDYCAMYAMDVERIRYEQSGECFYFT